MYAIVDIETTGGHADRNGITEIAVFLHNGKRITGSYTTLINPGVAIPPFLESYTGITNEMVAGAPSFEEVSEKIHSMLQDRIFVAHNVNFDYSFIKHHLQRCGLDLNVKKLCTVRLSRKAFPGFPSYSLGNLCHSLKIPLKDRHRAYGDAEATVKVLQKILRTDKEGTLVDGFLKKGSKEAVLPPNLPREQFEALPTATGIYYFYDSTGKIIYIGKAVNIKKRVLSHFSGNNASEKRQHFLRDIHHVSCQVTATELQSFILESIEIKKHWPKHNKALKSLEFSYGIYDYEDQNGYIRLAVDRVRKNIRPLHTFTKITDALSHIQKLVLEFNLCPKLCMITPAKQTCYAMEAGACSGACEKHESPALYNARVSAAIDELGRHESYAIVDKGLSEDEVSCILIDRGRFYGMGYVSHSTDVNNIDSLKELISPQKENFFIRELLKPEKIPVNRLIRFIQP